MTLTVAEVCEALTELAGDKTREVRKSVTENEHIPEECACNIFSTLAADEIQWVHRPVAENARYRRLCMGER